MLWLYNALLPAGMLGFRLLSPWNEKVRAGRRGRSGAAERLAGLGTAIGGRAIWLHSTSAGEYEQARPLAALLAARRPDLGVVHTFFSPSGYEYAGRVAEARHREYLPEDFAPRMGRVLDTLRPRAVVFIKFDLWPNLVVEAHRRGIPVLLVDATLQPRSLRSRWPAVHLYREVYRRLACISAVSAADADRFRRVVPDHPALFVDGDTRFDQVMRRRQNAARVPIPPALRATPRPFTCIAGSTWGPDEAVVIPAWRELCANWSGGTPPRLLLVPHETGPERLAAVESQLRGAGLAWRRYSGLDAASADGVDAGAVVLVDRVGVLAELYGCADAAYVGGAFTTGVHNVMEPASMGLPVWFGSRHQNAPEAEMLLEAGGAGVVRSAVDLQRAWARLAVDASARASMGERARGVVEDHLGASERCLRRILAALGEDAARGERRAPETS